MKQIIQYQKTGDITVEDLPVPAIRRNGIVVRNEFSLISSGTERSSVQTAQANMLKKAQTRPDLVRQVMDNYKREGLLATYEKIQNRLDNYKDLGYCCAGTVVQSSSAEFQVGDRVACGGVGYAAHAEYVSVPRNLAARVPDGVGLDEAAFTTLASIALQGVRQADVRLGERVVVIGLGLVGLLTVQLLQASGCVVYGLDISKRNFELACKFGCAGVELSDMNALAYIESATHGYGADAVVISAASTSKEPVELACQLARKKGRVVILGSVPLDVPRSPAYEKELDFRMSCSYGPGRYDSNYEEGGVDYPQAYVRWTEQRNFEAVLDMIASKRVDVRTLVTHTFPIADGVRAYDVVTQKIPEPYLAILISYPQQGPPSLERTRSTGAAAKVAACHLGVIGAGNHVQSYLLPHLRKLDVGFDTVVTSKPVNANSAAKKFDFAKSSTDAKQVFTDEQINLVLIGSRHDSHAGYVIAALQAGKNVFVEKPLAIDQDQLLAIEKTLDELNAGNRTPLLMVGYNRRFSAAVIEMKKVFARRSEPLSMHYRVNAGYMPKSNWYQAGDQGGRVIGEIGHFIDTMQFLCDANPVRVLAVAPTDRAGRYSEDNVEISLEFSDGSVGHISYLANGSSLLPKEYLDVCGAGNSAVLDNFKTLTIYDGRKMSKHSYGGGKGHKEEMEAIVNALRNGAPPIPVDTLFATSRASFAIIASLHTAQPIVIEGSLV